MSLSVAVPVLWCFKRRRRLASVQLMAGDIFIEDNEGERIVYTDLKALISMDHLT